MEQQMTINRKKSYTEILEILRYMDKIYVDKIPKKLIEFFEENKLNDYDFNYDITIELSEQNLNDNTLALLAMLNLNYWCESEEHKKELMSKYNNNEQKYQKELLEKYNPDNLFKKQHQKNKIEDNTIKEVALVEYKEPIFKRFINKIKTIFNIK